MFRSVELSTNARNAIQVGPNFLSIVTYWEVMIKAMKGTLDVGDPRVWWKDALIHLVATPLLIKPQHIDGVYELPMIHKDPFDRVLIAQAIAEDLAFVSSDSQIAGYASKKLKIIN
jgi:PIN domain nuclease of toxin-antitoxin system